MLSQAIDMHLQRIAELDTEVYNLRKERDVFVFKGKGLSLVDTVFSWFKTTIKKAEDTTE
jgi:hypothetical protein